MCDAIILNSFSDKALSKCAKIMTAIYERVGSHTDCIYKCICEERA